MSEQSQSTWMVGQVEAFMATRQRVKPGDALDRFINERVLGERGFAIRTGTCTYDHRANGGCEIGQYLPPAVAERLSNGLTYDQLPEEVARSYEEQRLAEARTGGAGGGG